MFNRLVARFDVGADLEFLELIALGLVLCRELAGRRALALQLHHQRVLLHLVCVCVCE